MQLGLPLAPPAPLEPSEPPVPLEPLTFLFVRNPRARRYLVRVDPEGHVRVTIPRGGSRRQADAFATQHVDWIHRQRSRLVTTSRSSVQEQERRSHRERAPRELPPRVFELAVIHGLTVSRVSVRNQRSRWGSCGRDGHICLNWRLMLMPPWVCDYVIVHELMHLRRMDHSLAYWRLVAAACPDYQQARRWLLEHGTSLR